MIIKYLFLQGGSLGISTANEDAERTSNFILDNMDNIDQIIVTLDSHHVRVLT
jgi:hypothetical protein